MVELVFSGSFYSSASDLGQSTYLFKGLLVKDIFANLFAAAVVSEFSQVRPILLIRNPFAVAVSQSQMMGSFEGDAYNPLKVLEQPGLKDEFPSEFLELVYRKANKNPLLDRVLVWAITNYLPMKQFSYEQVCVVFYEDLLFDPYTELEKIYRFAELDVKCGLNPPSSRGVFVKPSRVTQVDRVGLASEERLTSWQKKMPPETYRDGIEVLKTLGLEHLYSEASMPVHGELAKIMKVN